MSRIIRASEIGEYVFCHRAWWLRAVQGYQSTNVREMEAGTHAHVQRGRAVSAAATLRVIAIVILLVAFFTLFASSR
jgi:CRISPR/Cas system-associated exonuclease Cas4 (RecB family)